MDRFWSKVNKTDGCWLWTAAIRGNSGYGGFKLNGKVVSAHRYSYELHNGPLASNMLVCHTCDNRLCVNPAHLFAGTYLDNFMDAVQKGRIKFAPRPHPTKLTAEKVREMRSKYIPGIYGPHRLGKEYGVDKMYVKAILRREYWKGA